MAMMVTTADGVTDPAAPTVDATAAVTGTWNINEDVGMTMDPDLFLTEVADPVDTVGTAADTTVEDTTPAGM